MKRSYGYRPDTHDKSKDLNIRGLLGARLRMPAAFSLDQYSPGILDQGQTSSCVGFAFAQAIYERCRAAGSPISLPSPVAIYTFARAIERAQLAPGVDPPPPLQDNGSEPQLAVQGIDQWGVPSNDVWPFSPDTINAEPDLLDLEYASAFKVAGYYRIDSEGSARLDDIRQAISSGYPVLFGTQVDQAFEDYDGKGALGAPDPEHLLGGHMLHFTNFTADGNFGGPNQWGVTWGRMGMGVYTPEFVDSEYVGDIVALTIGATGHPGTARNLPKPKESEK